MPICVADSSPMPAVAPVTRIVRGSAMPPLWPCPAGSGLFALGGRPAGTALCPETFSSYR